MCCYLSVIYVDLIDIFVCKSPGLKIKEYQQEHKNNAVRRNMNIYEYVPCNLTGPNFF